jgi:citrate lyase subunit beta / citryl-CoA lyase
MIRSFLFTPANVPRRVDKALGLAADAVILDLEDSVAPQDKAPSRKSVVEAARKPRQGLLYVRVNAPSSSSCYEDLAETLAPGIDGVVVPKIESAADLHAIDWLMANLERMRGIAEGALDLMPQIETAAGMQRVDRILQARSLRSYRAPWRVKRVCFGAADYAHALALSPSLDEPELADARARLVLASRAAGLENPIDSPWFHFKEAAAFARSLERSRRGGFQGRCCVHPDQIAPVNAAYAPTSDEIAAAERIVRAFRESESRGAAALEVDGQMVDYPVAERAQSLLEVARRLKLR